MVVTQVALALVLLSAGGLVVRSFERLLAANPGLKSDGVLTFSIAMGPPLFPVAEAFAFQERLETELQSLPGVTKASATWIRESPLRKCERWMRSWPTRCDSRASAPC
jgi:putative ABC transport system permease protein